MFIKNLRSRMISHIILIIIVVTLITVYFFYRVHQKSIERHLKSDVIFYSLIVEDIILNTMKHNEGFGPLYNTLANFLNLNHIQRIRLVDSDGRIAFSLEKQEEEEKNLKDFQISKFINDPEDIFTTQISKGNKTAFLRWKKLKNKISCQKCHDKSVSTVGVLWVESSDKLTESTFTLDLLIFTGIGLGIIFFLTIATELFFMNSVDRPIKEITKIIKTIEEGNFSARIKQVKRDELGQLALSMNRMFEKLDKAQKHLINQQQLELNQAKTRAKIGEYAASLAHEIKNPISGIVFAVNSIMRETDPEDKRLDIFEEILKQANMVERNLEALLSYAKQSRLEYSTTNINEIIERILLFIKNQPDAKIIKMVPVLEEDLPKIMADPNQIEQVIFNLITNAMQSMQNGGTLTLRTSQDNKNNHVKISIKDTGEGIPGEIQQKIFGPFYTTKEKGTGLGLTICEEIIIRHNGKIYFESEPGYGTIFIVELPIGNIEISQPMMSEKTKIHKNYNQLNKLCLI